LKYVRLHRRVEDHKRLAVVVRSLRQKANAVEAKSRAKAARAHAKAEKATTGPETKVRTTTEKTKSGGVAANADGDDAREEGEEGESQVSQPESQSLFLASHASDSQSFSSVDTSAGGGTNTASSLASFSPSTSGSAAHQEGEESSAVGSVVDAAGASLYLFSLKPCMIEYLTQFNYL
jgi:hypothetical protein